MEGLSGTPETLAALKIRGFERGMKAGCTKCLKERFGEILPVSRVGWRFSSAMHKAGGNSWGRKYYPTLTQNKSYHGRKAKGICGLCLD